jgi:hypothetical protein
MLQSVQQQPSLVVVVQDCSMLLAVSHEMSEQRTVCCREQYAAVCSIYFSSNQFECVRSLDSSHKLISHISNFRMSNRMCRG